MENVKTHPKDDALFRRSSFVSRLLRLDDISRKEMMLVGLLLALILSILFILTNLGLIYRILNIEAGTRTVNFSGKIVNKADGTNLISGTPACVNGGADTCDFRVRIYDASSGGNLLFEEEHANVELGDTDGVFSLDINSICNSAASGSSDWGTTACVSNGGVDFSSSSLFLELAFAPGGAGSYIEVFARKQLSNTGSAFYAERAGTLDTGFTSGSIVFEGSSGISEDNSNLFWDNASKYLGVGVNDPGYEIDVDGDIYLRSQGIDNKSGQISFQATTTAAGDRTGYIRQDGTDGINSLLQIGTSGYIGFVLDSNIVSILHNNGLTIGTTTVGANTLSLYQDTDNEAILVQAPNLINKPSFSLQNLPLSTDLNTGKAFEIKVTGESFGRVQFYSDGAYGIGPGSATRDVFLSRAAANRFLISANKVSSSADLTITRALRVGSTSAPFAYLDTAGGTASLASIRVRAGVATAAPTAGDIYSDGTDLFFYNGSGWDDLTATGSLWIDYGTFINYGANPVSIGTASTSGELLTINNAANDTYLRVQNTSTGATSADGGSLGYASASSVLELWNLENAGLSFGTNGTERLTISASGVLTASNLAGGGNQCVQVDNSGILSGSGSVCGGTSYWTQSGSNIYYNTGNISVGTTASQAKIHAQTSASANMLMFENTGGTADKRAFGFYNYYGGTSSSNLLVLRAYNNSYSVVRDLMTFNHDGAVSMQGDFAIGTTTPAFKLDVRQNTASTHIGNFYSSTDNYGLTIGRRSAASTGVATHIAANDATGYGIIQAYNYDSVGGGAVPLSIQASGGDVGIGTSVPGHKLDVTDRMRVRSGAGGTAGIWFSDSSAANRAFFGLSDDDATPVAGIYNAGWRLNVDSAGHVGVGTTAPDEYLHVEQDQPTFKITSTNALSTSSGTEKIANIDFEGQNNNVYRVSGRIAFRQDGTWSTSTDTISPTAFEVYLQDSSASDNFSIPVLKIDRNEIVTAPGIYNNLMFASVRDVQVDSSGNLGFISSSIRYKENVVNMENIDWLYNLRPVNYNYKVDSAKQKQYGLIAEEVDQINPYFVSYNKEGLPETVNYSFFISPIIQALIDQKNEIDTVKTDIENIKLQLISTSGTSNGTTPLEYSDYLEVISLKVTGLVAFGADTVGTEVIPAGETEVSVNFSESYSTPPIVTGTGASDLILTEQINFIITDITETEFIIKLNNAATEDIEINWHAFEKAI